MDIIDFGRYIGALLVTLAILGGLAIGARRFAPHLLAQAGQVRLRTKRAEPRLRVTDTLSLDPKRRVVVLSWDDQETALLLSPTGETLIATKPAPTQTPSFVPEEPAEPSEPAEPGQPNAAQAATKTAPKTTTQSPSKSTPASEAPA